MYANYCLTKPDYKSDENSEVKINFDLYVSLPSSPLQSFFNKEEELIRKIVIRSLLYIKQVGSFSLLTKFL